MADDVLEQILIQVKESPFYSIQLDESNDIECLLNCWKAAMKPSWTMRYLLINKNLQKHFLSNHFHQAVDMNVSGKAGI